MNFLLSLFLLKGILSLSLFLYKDTTRHARLEHMLASSSSQRLNTDASCIVIHKKMYDTSMTDMRYVHTLDRVSILPIDNGNYAVNQLNRDLGYYFKSISGHCVPYREYRIPQIGIGNITLYTFKLIEERVQRKIIHHGAKF